MREGLDGSKEDVVELGRAEDLRIDFGRKKIRVAHWELQYLRRRHFSPPTSYSFPSNKHITIRLLFAIYFVAGGTLVCTSEYPAMIETATTRCFF